MLAKINAINNIKRHKNKRHKLMRRYGCYKEEYKFDNLNYEAKNFKKKTN